jgi:hypothetical protein
MMTNQRRSRLMRATNSEEERRKRKTRVADSLGVSDIA